MVVISASRREDIPAFRFQQFFSQYKEGKILYSIRRQDITYEIKPDDFFVFWTKNPSPALPYINEICHKTLWQVTCNGYGTDIEPNVPLKGKVIVPAIKELAKIVGPKSVVWRYDPICITDNYQVDEHIKRFAMIANKLQGQFRYCTISFVDIYGKLVQSTSGVLRAPTMAEIHRLCEGFSNVASRFGFEIRTCAETYNLRQYGILHGKCIDPEVVSDITGKYVPNTKDTTQRSACGCMPSIDIGQYRQCKHGCLYCYAK